MTVETPSIWQESVTWKISWICIVCGEKGDILVADIEELEILDGPEIHARRLNATEMFYAKNDEFFTFPIADGTVKLSGGDQTFRKPTLKRDHSIRGEELRDDLRGRGLTGLSRQTQ